MTPQIQRKLRSYFKKETIRITCPGWKEGRLAYTYKGLGVNKRFDDSGKFSGWVITHIQSGMRIPMYSRLEGDCTILWKVLFCAYCMAREFDWTQCKTKISRNKREVLAAVNRARSKTVNDVFPED